MSEFELLMMGLIGPNEISGDIIVCDATGSKVTKDIIKTIATLPDAVEGLTGLDLKKAIAKATGTKL